MTGVAEGSGQGPEAGRPLLLGVRHHGPGSARAVRAALDAARPRTVLVEGPPEADALIPLAADEDMRPPVALLAHAVDEPGRSAFWPLAEFSPEWVALRWALEHGVPARFIDLPATHTLAWEAWEEEGHEEGLDRGPRPEGQHQGEGQHEGESGNGDGNGGASGDADAPGAWEGVRGDPLGRLAAVAGYDDPERWWEDVVEHRSTGAKDPFAPFSAIEEAMGALREACATEAGEHGGGRDLVREAYMRIQVRAAQREFGPDGVAVVCGAWHVPALRRKVAVAADRALVKGLPKVKADLTWVPWTHRRLARAGGYGAGIDSPGWYAHLFGAPDRPVERWLTKVAVLLRAEDRMVSSAHVIEAVRLAETLAALRGRPLPGLSETSDAVRAVLCEGSDVPLALVRDRLVVGDVLGEVPAGAPAVPLQRDLDRLQRRLRLKPEADARELALDLRKDNDAERSRLLHRLRLLRIEWGDPTAAPGSTGTFREAWRLRWEPELSVRTAEAGVWGTTVLAAATAKAEADAVAARGLAEVTGLAERCLLAALPDALPTVMRVLADRAALDTDVGHLAQALPALVRSLRYGDVRGTDTRALAEVAAGLAERVFVGLPPACASLDADAADEMRRHVDAVHAAVGMLEETSTTPGRADAPAGASAGAPTGSPTDARTGTATEPAGERSEAVEADGGGGRPGAFTGGGRELGGGPRPAHGGLPGAVEADGGGGRPGAFTGGGRELGGGPRPAHGGLPGAVEADGGGGRPGAFTGGGRELGGESRAARGGLRERWRGVLRVLSGRDTVPGVIRGRTVRLLLDDGELDQDEAARLMGLALSPGTPPSDAAAWIEGFVGGGSGGGLLLMHDERLLGLVDGWLTAVPADAFTDVLPLLRRTFSAYEPGVRRTLGELVRRGPGQRGSGLGPGSGTPGFAAGLDEGRADAVLPVVRLLLGPAPGPGPGPGPGPDPGPADDDELAGVGT